jgi:hypothetical protein
MQVSLYLSDELIERLDELATRSGRSRSATVQSLLERTFSSGGDRDLLTLAGTWHDPRPAEQIIREVSEGRSYNRRSDRTDR